jgi:hypothetical protein
MEGQGYLRVKRHWCERVSDRALRPELFSLPPSRAIHLLGQPRFDQRLVRHITPVRCNFDPLQ